ncbi:response regulator transcription factor [Kitasatospora sp. NPDC057198]|uniref:response regulator transcription factor n=1 Tax=Kitasatospora sp. NPDC057198 TaxID=3346046 RepID=UPI00362F1436
MTDSQIESVCPFCSGITLGGSGYITSPASAELVISSLSQRELDTLRLIGAGMDNRTAAKQLSVSERTVKAHVTAIFEKLQINSRLQAGLLVASISCTCSKPTSAIEPDPHHLQCF